MKIKLSIFVFFAALFIVFGSAAVSFGQNGQITGGYGEANVKDKDVIAAANFAVRKGAKKEKATISLVAVKQAQVQVVAGLNYELCLEVTSKKSREKAVMRYVKTIVYRDLKNRYSLTSWTLSKEPLECND